MADILAGPGMALARPSSPPVHAARWSLLVFGCGTSLSAALQRLLLEPDPGLQRLVELKFGEVFAALATAVDERASSRIEASVAQREAGRGNSIGGLSGWGAGAARYR